MKLSFSIPKSSSSSRPTPTPTTPADVSAPQPQFVTVFDPSKTLAPTSLPPIPPIPNADLFRPYKKMKNLLPPPSDSDPVPSDTHFVLDTSSDPTSTVSYGLTLRSKPSAPTDAVDPAAPAPLRSFHDDISQLSDDRGFDEFAAVPVDGFGAAVLAGYGWKEGMPIGRNRNKEDPKVVQYERRQVVNAGLGYVPAPDDPKRRGKRGAVEDKKASSRPEERRAEGKSEERRESKREEGKPAEMRRESKREEVKPAEKLKSESKGANGDSGVRWLRSNIRVRVVSKEFRRGKFYRQKGKVMGVVGRTRCDVIMDESGEIVDGVGQEILETALPKRGGNVVVLYGKHKGVFGSLVEKDMGEETAVVEDADSRARINVYLDQIAEYVGDPSDLGY